MKHPIHELRLLLNYDTYNSNVLTFEQRMSIHKNISKKLSGDIPVSFDVKNALMIERLLRKIKSEKYKHKLYVDDYKKS